MTLERGARPPRDLRRTRRWEDEDGVPISELMIERALATGAQMTPVEGLAAAALGERDGAAALLRY